MNKNNIFSLINLRKSINLIPKMNEIAILGPKKDSEAIRKRLINKYGKESYLIDVVKSETEKYGFNGSIILT